LIENYQEKGDNLFRIWGDSTSCNLNPRLRGNIINCQYFKDIYMLKTHFEVCDELCKNAGHAEPWAVGASGIPSTMFCCLYKLMLMKLTIK